MQNFSPDQISQLAYQLWQQRGCPEGSPELDWERAVRLLEEPSDQSNAVLSSPAPSAAAPEMAAPAGSSTMGSRNQGANSRGRPDQLKQGKVRTQRDSSL